MSTQTPSIIKRFFRIDSHQNRYLNKISCQEKSVHFLCDEGVFVLNFNHRCLKKNRYLATYVFNFGEVHTHPDSCPDAWFSSSAGTVSKYSSSTSVSSMSSKVLFKRAPRANAVALEFLWRVHGLMAVPLSIMAARNSPRIRSVLDATTARRSTFGIFIEKMVSD